MDKVLKTYLKKLTNLSSSNKSLLQLRLYGSQDIDVNQFDFLDNKPSFDIIQALVTGKGKIALCDNLDSRNDKVNEATRTLKKIFRRENFINEERGARDLYVGWPFVQGKFMEGTSVRCPLLFFPVTLEVASDKWYLKVRKDVNVTFNKSFLLAYGHFNQVKIGDEILERTFDNFDGDSQEFRNELYQYLKDSPLEINFNQDIFSDKLIDFKTYKKDEYDRTYGNGEIKLIPEAVIGIYAQAGSYLVPDYEKLLESSEFTDLEDFFLKRSQPEEAEDKRNMYRFLKQVREDQTFTPFAFDASQENAIKAIKKGNSLVVQGPPGTGKSQLICNLISDFIARGQKVLVVCQKRAALDVVFNRLKEQELSEFVALVHDFKNDRKTIYEQIDNQIENIDEYKQRNNSLDSIYLEREFLQSSRKIDQITEELEEFKEALFNSEECGYSPKELYLTSDPEQLSVNLKLEYREFTSEKVAEFEEKLSNYYPYASQFYWSDHIWKNRISFKDFGVADLKELQRKLEEIPEYSNQFENKIKDILKDPISVEESSWVLDRESTIEDLLSILEDPKVYRYFKHMLHQTVERDWFIIKEKAVFECYKDIGAEEHIPVEQLGEYQEALTKALDSSTKIWKWLGWNLFSKDKYKIKRAIVANDLRWGKKGFKTLVKKIDNRLNLEHNITELLQCKWLIDFPSDVHQHTLMNWFHDQSVALEALTISADLRSFRDYLKIENIEYASLKSKLRLVIGECKKAAIKMKEWKQHLSATQVSRILNDPPVAQKFLASLKNDFDSICEFDRIREELSETEKEVIAKIHTEGKQQSLKEMLDLFQNSIRLLWIDHIETKYPILRTVSSQKMNQLEKELQKNLTTKLQNSRDILLMKVREKTYENAEYNRLQNMTTYRDLKHQVTKKRKIWPLRKTLANHTDEVFDLVPCWLASPESVSALFPMREIFDLVIFDEASQCYAERGIPAMYRGKQVVITGDDKQLSPNDLYQVRWEEEEEDTTELEIDSLLDLSKKYLMEVQLMGHYRSRSLDLIDFSNNEFYKNSLRLLPDFRDVNEQEPGIKYEKVDGEWKGNINTIEAERVVDIIKELLTNGQKDIGVVTFNFKQQNHIQDILEEVSVKEKFSIPDNLFVKNIENVQGDERDIIIFSIGYAPDSRGRFNMQFGSLNMEKGENRLNVAVTRAREKIFVVSSILPQQMKVDDAKHPGPKLFKKYLQYAFDVSEGIYVPTQPSMNGFKPDWYLKSKVPALMDLSSKELKLEEDLPFGDLTLKSGKHYKGLVLTDDNLYFSALSVKDSHAYVPMNLKRKKWKYDRVYSRNYWSNKEKFKEEILKSFS